MTRSRQLHSTHTIRGVALSLFILLWANYSQTHANESVTSWPFCHPNERSRTPSYLDLNNTRPNEQQNTHMQADEVQGQQGEQYQLKGNVKIWRGRQWMEADEAHYHATTEDTKLFGEIRLGNLNVSAQGKEGLFNLGSNQGQIKDATYYLSSQHGRGSADIIRFESTDFTRLKKANYTTCDEGRNDWYIHARSVTLNRKTGIGTAAPVYITFYKVPILFSPYLSFPIDDKRKSGFLFPSFGRSKRSGSEISAPYYLNLGSNYDATITPRYMSRRGVLLDNEFRYLFRKNEGEINIAYLPNDDVYDDDRSLYALNHRSRPAPHWYGNVDIQYVSDQEYLKDFGSSQRYITTTHLEERANLSYIKGNTNFSILLQGYQTLDKTLPESQRPYRRLPQISYQYWTGLWQDRLHAAIDSEYVYFDRSDSLLAHRADFTPSLSLPFFRQAGYITPKITLRHTQYRLSGTTPDSDDNISRTLLTRSIDAGVFLERNLSIFNKDYKQTLEPRLFYVRTPYKDQSQLPFFDTALSTFSRSYLFSEDRFSGADRIGDTEQITVALTSRLLDKATGIEKIKGSIGQIFYLQDRRVGLSGEQRETASQSDIVGELSTRINRHWSSRAEAIWNHKNDEVDRGSFRIAYEAGPKRHFSTSYYWNRSTLSEQTDIALSWPLSARWQLVGRHLFAHRETRTMEAIAGLEYTSCCWSLSILHRRYQYAELDEPNESIMLQLQLKGLASIGSPIERIITENILGETTH